jgi:TetR/AcrR family transcriptional repressor of multidrug resistance operon
VRTRDERKEREIRKQALEMIVKHGFDGFSMQKLAKAACVSPATLYIYFKDRDDLVFQLYRETMERMSEETLRNFEPAVSFEEGLGLQWRNRARFCMEHPLEAHFMEQIRYSPWHERALQGSGSKFTDAMRAFVKNAIKKKELVEVPVEVYWSVAFAPLYQLVKMHMHKKGLPGSGRFELDAKTLQLTLDLVLKALKP